MPGRPNVELELRRGSELIQKHELKGRKFFILGRQPGMSHILVEDDTVSRQHAALVHCGAAVYLFDLKSAKGVAVGGKPIKPMEPRLLAEGDAFTLGDLAVQYVVKGLGPPPAPGSDRWQPPAWAVVPAQPVSMRLMRGEEAVQELDLSRKPAYVMGRNGQQADLVVPHDSVSRQHAAIVHGAPTADGSSSVHVVDLKSTMGTYVDPFSRGEWNRLPPNTPTILPVGGRVRLGECTTLLVYPSAAPPPAAKPAPEPEDEAPRFASMLCRRAAPKWHGPEGARAQAGGPSRSQPPRCASSRSQLQRPAPSLRAAPPPPPRGLPGGAPSPWGTPHAGLSPAMAPPSSGLSPPLARRQSTIVKDAMVSHGVQSETVNLYEEAAPATDEAGGAAAEEGGEESAQVSNNDIRNMLLPFIRKPAPAVEEGADEGGRKRRKKKRKGADDDSSDDNEPPPPLTLDKLGPVRAHALHTHAPHTHALHTHAPHTHALHKRARARAPRDCNMAVACARAWRACMVGCPSALPHALPQCPAPCPAPCPP